MWKLSSDDKEKKETVLREARKAGVKIGDYKMIKKDGKLYMLYSDSPIHVFEIGKYV